MFRSVRNLRRTLVLGVSAVSLAAASTAAVAVHPALASATGGGGGGGGGASLPYAEVQAEDSATNGTVIGPSYTQGQLADEASGRKAVTLQGAGQYVTFTTPVAANSIDFRYSIPDSPDGSVYTAPLSLYVNGVKQADFTVTNAYSWYYGSYPFTNTPGGNPHHFYDEAHRLFATTCPAGTTFKLQIDSEDTASSYTIDFADFEQVGPALTQPAGSVSVTSEGADPAGANDSTNAFNAAISAAGAGGTVWIPPGTYNIPGHISVNNVTIAGAGMWYSTITGTAPGFYGNSAPAPSTNVHLRDFAISGNVQDRHRNHPGRRR
jgi:Alpha-1,3-glucanase catalytic domain D1/Pectate lyase superfamily protein